ncbi:SMAD/FHA domain-containing protein [Flagelloscypha sp. PMI_526]|nr:SMAD/FHA domain-containing protein [Flagelloscypha sp. PMI_526]
MGANASSIPHDAEKSVGPSEKAESHLVPENLEAEQGAETSENIVWGYLTPLEEDGSLMADVRQTFMLTSDAPTRFVGRNDHQSDVVIPEPAWNVSRFHARLAWNGLRGRNAVVKLTDYSRNGTWLGWERIDLGIGYPLRDGDIITFGTAPEGGVNRYKFTFLAAKGTPIPCDPQYLDIPC